MKTLRGKLFVSIGIILLLTAILNTFSAEIWIKKDLNRAGEHINDRLEEAQTQIRRFISFLLTFHIVQEATELDRVIQMTSADTFSFQSSSSLWKEAGSVLSYNPQLCFVQIQNSQGMTASISSEDAHLSPFSWAFDAKGILWVKVENSLFQAKQAGSHYLLFNPEVEKTPSLVFETTTLPLSVYALGDTPEHLFESLLLHKQQWIEKMEFIQVLLPWQEGKTGPLPLGVVKLDPKTKTGSCLLSKDLFSKAPLVAYTRQQEDDVVPQLVLRNTPYGNELDMVKSLSLENPEKTIITLGVSLSSLLKEISLLLQKTVILAGKDFVVGSTPLGITFSLEENPFKDQENISWQGKEYVVSTVDLSVLKIFVLTPLDEATATSRFLNLLSETTAEKISFTLIGAALFSFFIALFLLSNISKKITKPIALLSKAAETLGTGNYSSIVLPEISHRHDEVAVLARSFEGMVASLKERDKIHGLLNKVVSKEISQKILEQNIELSGEEKVVTVLFSDIRDFTHLAAGLPPRDLIEILNAYMTRMCRIIDETHGVVDKFIGDAIMTLYGAPVELDLPAVQAIDAALCMMDDLRSWNEERKKQNLVVFEIGIGIHTGLVYTGNMGAENRLNYTVVGSNVNKASRLCSVAKPMQILVSDETKNSPGVEERFEFEKLEPVLLKRIDNPVQVYAVKGRKSRSL